MCIKNGTKMAKTYKLDEIDRHILKILASRGNISNIELSKAVGISPSPCLRRVKILEEQKVITGYSAHLNFNALGYELLFFVSAGIDVSTPKEKTEFEKALGKIAEVVEIYLLNSGKDYLIKLRVQNFLDYKLIVNTKLTALPHIKHIRTTKISKILKHTNFVK